MSITPIYRSLGKPSDDVTPPTRTCPEELAAAYATIDELRASLAEMVGIYWGEGDGIEPAPQCIQRAWAALAEEVR